MKTRIFIIFIVLILIIFTFSLSCERADKVDYSLGNEDLPEMIEEPEEWSFPANPKEGDMVKDLDGNVWLYSSSRYSSDFEWHISFHSYIND